MTGKRAKREANRVNLTDRFIKSVKAPPAPERTDYWDTGLTGLGLRVSYGGSKVFNTMYRVSGRGPVRRMKLGSYPVLSLAMARDKALEALRDALAGIDPNGDKRAARTAPTFAYLAGEYLEKESKVHKKSWAKDETGIKELNAKFGHRVAADIDTFEFVNFLEAMRDRGAGVMANRRLALVRRIYSWGMEVERRIVSANPCLGMKRLVKEKSRKRWLNATEIKSVYDALPVIPERMGAFLRLALATGQRPHEEVRQMHTEELDLVGGWWIIPAEKAKNGKAHSVALNAEAIDAIQTAREARTDAGWIFPMASNPAEPMSNAAYRKPLDKVLKASGLAHFSPRDLRATAITHWEGEMGIARETVSKLANHSDPSVTASYVRNSYDGKKRVAMDAWGARLAEIKSGHGSANVVPLNKMQAI